MLRTIISITVILFCIQPLYGQCPDTNTTLNSQQAVTDYVTAYSTSCSLHDGNLTISGNDITDISGLSFLTEVTGYLYLNNMNSLTSLAGLENLTTVGGLFRLYDINQITDLTGLVGTNLTIENGIRISTNNLLSNIDALIGITTITGPLEIDYNPALLNLDGLNDLSSVDGNLNIHNNSALINIDGLNDLVSVTNNLFLYNNPSITTLDGLSNLESTATLYVYNNSSLTDCSGICSILNNGGVASTISIYNNPSECNSDVEIQLSCPTNTCHTGNLTLDLQTEVDAYIAAYANTCTVHTGNLTISGNDITDLSGLSFLSEVTGYLYLSNMNSLPSLAGLENLTRVGGLLRIYDLNQITDLTGLVGSSLTIENGIRISRNNLLTNIDALTGITTISGQLDIDYNPVLLNLNGLTDLSSVDGSLNINNNPALINIDGLNDLISITNNLFINNNTEITTLDGLSSLESASTLYIYNNPNLTDCSGICSILNNGGVASTISISNNPSECSSDVEIQLNCPANTCHIGNLTLDLQTEVDAYVSAYSNACTVHTGNLTISGNNITDLSGLSFLTEITGYLYLNNMNSLTSLAGLENVTTVGGLLRIYDINQITDLTGLVGSNLNLGGGLRISRNNLLTNIDALSGLGMISGSLSIDYNPVLANVDGLNDLSSVSTFMSIYNNPVLTNLTGLTNLESTSSLAVYSNSMLTDCSSLCSILNSGGVVNSVSIYGNPSECSSDIEIQLYCPINTCHSGNLILDLQTEVDAYVAAYSGVCSVHTGNLTISGNDITDISGLNFLTEVTGDLALNNMNSLTTLVGLENITTVGGLLRIYDVNQITDLTGLDGANLNIGNGLYISRNNIVENINALSGLTKILGYLRIDYNQALTNLDGLSDLRYVNGSLTINNNSSLTSCGSLCDIFQAAGVQGTITILNNPAACSSQAEIEMDCTPNSCAIGNQTFQDQTDITNFIASYSSCDSLFGNITIEGTVSDISGLAYVNYLSGNLTFQNNDVLTDLSGLTQLELNGNVRLYNCDAMTSVAGINAIAITNGLSIENCGNLTDISELSYLSSIFGNLYLNNNDLLTNLTGLENLTDVNGNVQITNHAVLSDCSSICDIINNDGINGTISISGNPSECNTVTEVALLCTPTNCPPADIVINNQLELNAFVSAYGACPDFPGSLSVRTSGVTNISALSFLTSIGGDFTLYNLSQIPSYDAFNNITTIDGNFSIEYSGVLTSLADFNSLTSIGGDIYINSNTVLTDVAGLNNLTSVNGSLRIINNSLLTTLDGLSNITTTGYLQISSNAQLTNLSGLENLNAVERITIRSNSNLTDCSAICSIINSDGIAGQITISGNPSECSSPTEVGFLCADSCPIGNVSLYSQNDVNAFVAYQSTCDSIFGDLTISGSTINDLSQLTFLNYIEGNLTITSCPSLTHLTGLNNLLDINGLTISSNSALTSISALNNITHYEGSVNISYNAALVNLDGLNQLTTIDGSMDILANASLVDLTGLDLLQSVGGNMYVRNHTNLTNLSGIQALNSVGGSLRIQSNTALTDCSIICGILNDDGVDGSIIISNNPSECSSQTEIELNCTVSCPTGNVTLLSQNEIDAFVANQNTCDSIFGNLTISGSTINDLSQLTFLSYIQGNLVIQSCSSLTDLTGLDNLLDIGGLNINNNAALTSISALNTITNYANSVTINYNASLLNLDGLNQVTSIGGTLDITSNAMFTDLTGLNLLQTVGGSVQIWYHANLTNLSGIQGLSSVGGNLRISNNAALTDCSVICGIIDDEGIDGSIIISANPSACSSLTEVSTFCTDTDCPEGTVVLSTQIEVDAFVNTFFGCDSLPDGLTINGGLAITDLSGLSFLNHIGDNLIIQNTQGITDLSGFQNIQTVAGQLSIVTNNNLTSIAELAQLTSVDGDVRIQSNAALPQITGLEQLTEVNGNLSIIYNPNLSDCTGICMLINSAGISGTTSIYGNPAQCSSLPEVTTFCSSADCPSDDVVLKTQNEVDAFVATFSTCDSLPGDLYINGYNHITDISGLSFISYVGGDLKFENSTVLTSLDGLQNITGVGGDLRIYNNRKLENLDALSLVDNVLGKMNISYNDSLSQINGIVDIDMIASDITVRNNQSLTDCDGLCGIINDNRYGGNLTIVSNPSACSSVTEVTTFCTTADCPQGDVSLKTQSEVDAFVATFSNCDSMPGNLIITGSNSITDLSGLSFISYIEGNLSLTNNYKITDLSGFDNLEKVNGDFILNSNIALASLAQLSQLTEVGGLLSIYNNDKLTLLSGLEQLTTIGSDLRIQQNAILSDCTGVCDLIQNGTIGGIIQISNNPSQCSTANQVQSICEYGSSISTIFINNLPATIEEGGTLNFEVAVDFAPSDFLEINLTSSNDIEIPLPATVMITPGQTFVPVSINLPDDNIPEKIKDITISAGTEFLSSAVESIRLTDDEDIPAIEIELLQDTISEAGGFYATQGVIRRVVDDGTVLNIKLYASQSNLLILPEGVNLTASEMEKSFYIGALDNSVVDGFKDVDITATFFIPSCNCDAEPTSAGVDIATLVVSDDDGQALSLQVNPLSLQEGEADAGDLTITRNTATDTDLEVFLTVSDDTELSLPVSVIIPQGSASVTIPMTTLSDPITDGNQEVTIQANSPGFAPGTVWVIVTDINKPDFVIADVLVPETNVPSEGLFEFRTFITNEGLAAAPAGAKLTGYLSKDLFIDDSDFIIGDFVTDAALPVGDTLELPGLGQAPFQPRDYHLIFTINSDEALTELLYLNNRSEPITITVLPDYLGSAFADDDLYVKGSPIQITGSSFKPDNTPVPNVALEIYITVGDVRRELSVTTDSLGNYETIFEPLPYESGHYTIGASFPEQGASDIDDEFDILGFKVNNGQYLIWELLLNEAETGTISIQNLSEAPLSNVSMSTDFLPPGCSLTFDTIVSLPASGTADITYQITGSEVTEILEYIDIPISISSDEVANIQDITGYYFCQAEQGYLRSEISSINTTMNKDNSRILEFMIFNDGMGETDDIEVLLPEVSWLQLVSPAIIPSISPGDTAVVSLNLIPTADLPLNTPGTGNIVINATNGNNLNIPFTIQKVSDETGNVLVDVIDQYTYFTEEAPHVEGATVKITHYFTGEVFAEGVTDADGLFSATDIPEGTHRLVVQAEDHFGYDGLVVINPGLTRDEVVFIEYQTISFSWDVVPTTIEDEYQIDLIIEFETNVPAPVVLMEMPDTMPQLFGDETFPFFITLTNVGLITANEVELRLPENDPEYIFVTNYEPQDLLAQQAIQVPVEMKRRDGAGLVSANERDAYASISKLLGIGIPNATANSAAGGGCTGFAGTVYWYECGPNGIYQQGAELFSYSGRSCPSSGGPSIPGIPGGPGGGSPGGPSGGCSDCGTSSDVPSVSIDCKCNDCLKNLFLAGANCAPGPVGAIGGAALQLVKGGNPFSPPNCVDGLLNAAALCGCTVCDCIADIADVDLKKKSVEIDVGAVINKIIGAASGLQEDAKVFKNVGPEFPTVLLTPMDDIAVAELIDNLQDYYAYQYFGFLAANENINELLLLVADELKNEQMFDAARRSNILAEMSSFDMPADSLTLFIDRWNETVVAWNAGVFTPNATYPDIVDKMQLDSIDIALTEADNYILSRGYQDADDMVNSAIDDVTRLTQTNDDPNAESAFNPVCASVTIQISQTLTMVREAFEGTLSVFNGHPTDALENLSLNLEILDENGVNSNDLFSIETTELNVLTGIDGTGVLGSEMDGFAKVLFIPEPGAAPENPRSYSFGGTISYLDPFSGLIVTLPLIPSTLTVNPSPDIFLHYFMQRDIYGDDPLTAPIEPIIPADLAVMIENNGYGVAQQVVIESAQPEIIDNEKGLAINLNLIGSNLQGEPFSLGLNTINFGDIQPFKTKIGQWYFTSSLLGHFTNYETNVVHLDSRGNPDLSLVSGAEIHELHHTISIYGDADDGIDDFLVNDIPDTEDNPDAIYLSQGSQVYDVFPAFTGEHTGNILAAGNTTTLEVDPLGIGWNYIKLDDPGNGNFEILSVTRVSDNQVIPLKNVWLTHVTIPDGGVQVYEDKFHFVDDFPSFEPETYTVVWSPLDPDPPAIVSITGHPSEVTSEQVTTLRVTFSEEIIDSTFGIEDLLLTFQGGMNLIDESVVITQVDSVSFDIDLSSLTTGNGYYVFTAQAAGVQDLTGTSGQVGEQAAWTQFLSLPVVQQFIGLPADYIASSFDTVHLLFNVPIDLTSFSVDDITITLNGLVQSGSLTLESLGNDDRLFKLSGLGSFLTSDETYMLNIDLPNILSSDQSSGLVVQSIPLILDTDPPVVTNMVRSNVGGIDDQHYTKMTINFSEDIEPFDSSALTLLHEGISQEILSTDINKVDGDWYEIIWNDDFTYPEGTYEFSIDMSQVRDLAENAGTGIESQQWIVDRTAELTISNLNISPDLGISATDGITSVLSVDVSFDISEEAREIFIYQNDNGVLSLLGSQTSASAGTLSFPVTFATGGQTSIEVWMEDLQGNQVMAEKSLYLDESQLTATWDMMNNQTISDHPASVDLMFSDPVVDLSSLPAGLITFSKDNNVLTTDDLIFTKQTSDLYQLTGLPATENLPGQYTLGIDLSYFTKSSSGIVGTGFSYLSWDILDLNQAPISNAGNDTTIVSPVTFMLQGDDSYDPDGDSIRYRWYPPAQVALSDSFIVNPVFDIDQSDHNQDYTFLLEVSDGDKTHTDNVTISIDLNDSISISQALEVEYCSTDSIELNWEVFGDVSQLDLSLSDNGGQSFDIEVGTLVDASLASLKIGLDGLIGTDFILMIADTLTGGFAVQSQAFAIKLCSSECSGDPELDADGDGVCDADDQCPDFDDSLIGQACDDGNECTVGETYDSSCNCSGGIETDTDDDGVCDENDLCPDFDDMLIGQACDDGNECTVGETYDTSCNCSGGVEMDADQDGVCDENDQCPDFDDTLIGQACDDGNECTIGETYDMACACSGGVGMDTDQDGVCDADDQCPDFDDTLIGRPCDDGNSCTVGETYDESCSCSGGVETDTDDDGICDGEDQCPNLDNSLIGQPCDDGLAYTENDRYTDYCTCQGTITAQTLCVQINTPNDDVEQNGNNGTIHFTSTDLDMTDGNNRGIQTIGLRFRNIDIPAGAEILSAYIQFTAEEVGTAACSLTIEGQAVADAPQFNTQINNVSSRTRTVSSVLWNVPAWRTVGASNQAARTPDISNIIEDIIAIEGFNRGNSMVMIITGIGDRTAYAYDGSVTQAPQLCIEYITCFEEGIVCDDGDDCTANDLEDGNCNCVGTAIGDLDQDGVCDALDICPGGDDNIDNNDNGIPDACDDECEESYIDIANRLIIVDKHVNDYIMTNGIVPAGYSIEYKAGQTIELMQGFEVKAGAEFYLTIEECQQLPSLAPQIPLYKINED